MIFDCEEIMTFAELRESLNLSVDELESLIAKGLPYTKAKDSKLFVMESVKVFLKRIQQGG